MNNKYTALTNKKLEETRKKISEQVLKIKSKGVVFTPRKQDKVKYS